MRTVYLSLCLLRASTEACFSVPDHHSVQACSMSKCRSGQLSFPQPVEVCWKLETHRTPSSAEDCPVVPPVSSASLGTGPTTSRKLDLSAATNHLPSTA